MIEKIFVTPVGSPVELATLNTANMDLLPSRGTTTIRTGTAQSSTHPPFQYDPSKGIRKPGPTDVICGRGKMTFAHPGNRRFKTLVMEKKDQYQKATRRDDKTRITHELVQNLRNGPEGGR